MLNTKSQNKIVVNQNWVFYIDFFMIVRVNRRKIYLIQEEDNILLQFSSEKVIWVGKKKYKNLKKPLNNGPEEENKRNVP